MHPILQKHVNEIAWRYTACARKILFVTNRGLFKPRSWILFASTFTVHIEIHLRIQGLPGVHKPEYLEQLKDGQI
jgi:hypothetical protein